MSKRIGRIHLIIPDCQVKPGVPLKHLDWISNYIEDKRPDVIVNIGDFADMPSLNSHVNPGHVDLEGKRYLDDIEIAKEGMRRLTRFRKLKKYKPEMVLTLGNHEERISREVEATPKLAGILSIDSLQYKQSGWDVVPFLRIRKIDGIEYAHYFTSGAMGRPVSSARALLTARHSSGVMGHVQFTDLAFHPKSGHVGIFCGTCYLHDENYLGEQGNNQRRQIVILHEVHDGTADPMFVSLDFLSKNYN